MTLALPFERIAALYLVSFASGIAHSLLYDLAYSFADALFKRTKWLNLFLTDLFVLTTAGCTQAVIFFIYTYGRVRIFALIMLFCGFLSYRIALSGFVRKRLDGLFCVLLFIIKRIVAALVYPIAAPIRKAVKRKRARLTQRMMESIIESTGNGYR
jgi:hypothetical protein